MYANSLYHKDTIYLNDIDSFWYRKCGLNIHRNATTDSDNKSYSDECSSTSEYVIKYKLKYEAAEFEAYRDFIFTYIYNNSKKAIGRYRLRELNKCETLTIASKIGLNVPKSYILNNKIDLENILFEHNEVIVKPMHEGVYEIGNSFSFVSYTTLITKKDMHSIPDNFPFAFFQERINKIFEIRVIYISGVSYAIAMFTQEHKESQVDGRRCAQEKLRMAPFKLPLEIENKIGNLMKLTDLQFGALDFIVTPENKYIFLEINPVGQFTAYGDACNYYLEKVISELL